MKKKLVLLLPVIFGVIALDQLTKVLVLKLMTLGQSISVIPGVINLTYIQNRGAAFGMLSNHRWVFMVISIVAIGGIGAYLFGFCKERISLQLGLAMIVGGGVGNMIDRIAYGNMIDRVRLGYVVDFLDFCAFDFWVWIFNVADAFVCIGAGFVVLALILDIISESRKKKEKNENN